MTKEMLIDKYIPGNTISDEKICMPVKLDNSGDIHKISSNLNSASHYYIVDMKEKVSSFLDLKEIQNVFENSQGQGFKALGISSMICEGVSPMALKILSDTGISVWKPISDDVHENLDLYASNQLMEFSGDDALSSNCNSNCSSCATSCS